jgi:hypothetical protein
VNKVGEGDYVGAALEAANLFAYHEVNSLSSTLGVCDWTPVARTAFNGFTGFVTGAALDALGQWNAIDRGDQSGYNLGQSLLMGAVSGVMNALFANTCFDEKANIFARGDWGEGWRPICLITTADEVLSRDEHNRYGKLVWKRVLDVFKRSARIWNLHVGGRIVGTTIEHPFYEDTRSWTSVGHLRINERIVGMEPFATTPVEGVADSGRSGDVYNLRVEDCHTYFVGGDDWGFSLWAHNAEPKYSHVDGSSTARDPYEGHSLFVDEVAPGEGINPRLQDRVNQMKAYQADPTKTLTRAQWVAETSYKLGGVSSGYESGYSAWERDNFGTPQEHHAISNPIFDELELHPVLHGQYEARDPRFVLQARDVASHNGYQQWHIDLDHEVITWLQTNPLATRTDFEGFLRNRYNQPDLLQRFPYGPHW